MAIKDTSRKPFIQDNDTNVKVGIDLPIRRGDELDGFFASTSTTIESVKNNIRNLLNTNEGERFFQPNLGMNLRRLLFEHITWCNFDLFLENPGSFLNILFTTETFSNSPCYEIDLLIWKNLNVIRCERHAIYYR